MTGSHRPDCTCLGHGPAALEVGDGLQQLMELPYGSVAVDAAGRAWQFDAEEGWVSPLTALNIRTTDLPALVVHLPCAQCRPRRRVVGGPRTGRA